MSGFFNPLLSHNADKKGIGSAVKNKCILLEMYCMDSIISILFLSKLLHKNGRMSEK